MPVKLTEGDTVGLTGEVTLVHDDGTVTVRLHGVPCLSPSVPSIWAWWRRRSRMIRADGRSCSTGPTRACSSGSPPPAPFR